MSREHTTSPPASPPSASRWDALIDWLALVLLLAAGVVWPT